MQNVLTCVAYSNWSIHHQLNRIVSAVLMRMGCQTNAVFSPKVVRGLVVVLPFGTSLHYQTLREFSCKFALWADLESAA